MRIAQVVGKLNSAGVEAVVNNYYRHINHDSFQFDYIIDSDSTYLFNQEMIDNGARYYVVPPTTQPIARIRRLIELFRKNRCTGRHVKSLLPI